MSGLKSWYLPHKVLTSIENYVSKIQKGESLDETHVISALEAVKVALLQMTNICDGLARNPDIGRILEHMIQTPTILMVKDHYTKLMECLLVVYKSTSQGYKSEKLRTWVLNLMQTTLRYDFKRKKPLVLMQMGFSPTLLLKQQMKQDIENLCNFIRYGSQSTRPGKHRKCKQGMSVTDKFILVKQIAEKIVNLLAVVEFWPLWSAILDFLLIVPKDILGEDIMNIFNVVMEYTEQVTSSVCNVYEIQTKIWKLSIPALEKSVLQMTEECSLRLPLPCILNTVISSKNIVKACSEEYDLFYVVFNILYTLVVSSHGNTVMVEIITCFLISVKERQKQNQGYLHFCSQKLQPLIAALSNDPKELSKNSFHEQVSQMVKIIQKLEVHRDLSEYEYEEFVWLLLQHKEWYYFSLWTVLTVNKQYVKDFVKFILYYVMKERGDYVDKFTEFIHTLRALLLKKNLKTDDIEYAVCGVKQVKELQSLLCHTLFIFLHQSESGFTVMMNVCKLAGCSTSLNVLSMTLYLHDVHSVSIEDWKIEKQSCYKETISNLLLELKSNSEQAGFSEKCLNQVQTIQSMCEQLFGIKTLPSNSMLSSVL